MNNQATRLIPFLAALLLIPCLSGCGFIVTDKPDKRSDEFHGSVKLAVASQQNDVVTDNRAECAFDNFNHDNFELSSCDMGNCSNGIKNTVGFRLTIDGEIEDKQVLSTNRKSHKDDPQWTVTVMTRGGNFYSLSSASSEDRAQYAELAVNGDDVAALSGHLIVQDLKPDLATSGLSPISLNATFSCVRKDSEF